METCETVRLTDGRAVVQAASKAGTPSDETCEPARRVAEAVLLGRASRPVEAYELSRPVFLVGFMGAGKTSVARRLARARRLASVDMDTYLERREGRKVRTIFAEAGEEGFRAVETDVLRELAAKDPLLISCGGGVVLKEENRAILKRSGFVIHLKVTADEAASRISDTSTRPLFEDLDAARVRCVERAPLYDEVADAVVDTAGKSVAAIAREVSALLEREGVLCLRQK